MSASTLVPVTSRSQLTKKDLVPQLPTWGARNGKLYPWGENGRDVTYSPSDHMLYFTGITAIYRGERWLTIDFTTEDGHTECFKTPAEGVAACFGERAGRMQRQAQKIIDQLVYIAKATDQLSTTCGHISASQGTRGSTPPTFVNFAYYKNDQLLRAGSAGLSDDMAECEQAMGLLQQHLGQRSQFALPVNDQEATD